MIVIRKQIIEFLRNYIPDCLWILFWFLTPLVAIIFLPAGLLFFQLLELFGIFEPRAVQLLMLSSIAFGFVVGISTLLLIDKAEISTEYIQKVKWLARFSIISPVLILLIIFWIFSRP